jgi:hypothetical protein
VAGDGTASGELWKRTFGLERGKLPFDYFEFIQRKPGIYIRVEDLSLLIDNSNS